MYAILAESTALETIIAHTTHLKAPLKPPLKAPLKADPLSPSPPPSTPAKQDSAIDITANQTINTQSHASTLTKSTIQKPPTKASTLPDSSLYEDKEATGSTPSTDYQHLQASYSPTSSLLRRINLSIQLLVHIIFCIAHIHRLILPHLKTTMSLYRQATQPLRLIRVGSIFIISRIMKIVRRTSSYVVSHRELYPPFLAVFVPHLLFWVFLLSIGEMYVLWMCVLTVIWLLSWLR
ncbi:hypothetical protein TgHK011_002757 [Trichoderma gracile]|nr:hypothetical protein TgHK011_002757 [Trichoderma gracile]